jgi:ribA/ribD-fused uncharacterized protein
MADKITEFKGEYAWLSNFANVDIVYRGFPYQSVERAYQAEKNDSVRWKMFCGCPLNPEGLIKKLSRSQPLRSDWEEIKVQVMLDCLRLKFKDEYYRKKLIATGDMEIIEGNYWKDRYWGICLRSTPPKGQNILGKLIMQVREEIRSGIS